MRKVTTEVYCDICGKVESSKDYANFRFRDIWGSVEINFNLPAEKSLTHFQDCCPDCAKEIKDSIEEAIAKIKSPLEDVLK